jgi:hypothetical protein
MIVHAEFYHLSTGYKPGSIPPVYSDEYKKPIPACGDRAVIILDGRNDVGTWHNIAASECKKRGYMGYRIMKGQNFTTAKPITDYKGV